MSCYYEKRLFGRVTTGPSYFVGFCPSSDSRYCRLTASVCAFACFLKASGALSKRGDLLGELFGEAWGTFVKETIRRHRKPVKIRPRSDSCDRNAPFYALRTSLCSALLIALLSEESARILAVSDGKHFRVEED